MPRKTAQALWTIALVALLAIPSAAQERPTVGVAFGGGGARGIAHIGVIKWFEEHHIPIDMAAGISVGGLIGGAFATGMPAAELEAMLAGIDWDEMFGFSNFSFKNIRRKTDQRAYPSRLEFGLRDRLSMPTSLNNGQQVDLLLSRIAAAYYATPSFDSLPTPFRVVATDLRTATPVVIGRGSLAQAMRATVSLPGVFPPVELDGRVLVDGGVMNNVPADVARSMGAGVVVAVNVGDLSDNETISYSIFGLAGATIDAMMRANTKAGIASADIVINVPPKGFGTLDWRKSTALIAEGYKAAEANKDTLLRYAVDDLAWQAWLDGRAARRKQALPVPAFAGLDGVAPADQRRMHKLLAKHVGVPLDVATLEIDLEELSGLDRYESITWQLGPNPAGDIGLTIRARPKPYAPPLLMLGINLENTTTDDFTLGLAARYLRFDVLRSGSELRADVQVGANPSAAVAVYHASLPGHVPVALRGHRRAHAEPGGGRRAGGAIRAVVLAGGPRRGHQPRPRQRRARGRVCRPPHRQGKGGRSGPTRGVGRRNGPAGAVAARHPGQPRGAVSGRQRPGVVPLRGRRSLSHRGDGRAPRDRAVERGPVPVRGERHPLLEPR